MPLRRAVAALFSFVLVAAACGDDDSADGLSGGEGFSIEGALAELPLDEEPGTIVSIGDIATAMELADIERPDGDDDAIARWAMALNGVLIEEQDLVALPLPEMLRNPLGSFSDVTDELGWGLADVETFAEVSSPPYRTIVVSAGHLGEDVFEFGDVEELEDGIVTAGEGDDLEQDLTDRTAARPLGAPLRMGASGNRIIASSTTEVVRSWLDGELPTFADSALHRQVAAALDDADAYGALLTNFDWPASDQSNATRPDIPVITAAFDVVGIGWSVVDGEGVITIVHHFEDEDAAEEQVENIEAILREGTSLVTDQPLDQLLVLDDVTADGPLTITTVRPGDDGHLMTPYEMLIRRELLFVLG